jgi:hypothetical protein
MVRRTMASRSPAGFSRRIALALAAWMACACTEPSDLRPDPDLVDTPKPPSQAAGSAGHSSWPVLVVSQGEDERSATERLTRAGVPVEDAATEHRRAAALALGSLSPPALGALAGALEELTKRLEIKANPLVEDLDDDPPGAELSALARTAGPSVTASDAVATHRHASGDRRLVVGIAAQCPTTPERGVSCVPLWPAVGADDDGARARFFAWSLASAGVLSVRDAAASERAVSVLRARSLGSDSAIALVLTEADLAGGRDGADQNRVRARAARALELARSDPTADTRLLARLAEQAPSGRVVPWLQLDADEVLVVPRLGALGHIAALAREIDETASRIHLEMQWVQRPATW